MTIYNMIAHGIGVAGFYITLSSEFYTSVEEALQHKQEFINSCMNPDYKACFLSQDDIEYVKVVESVLHIAGN